MGGTTRFFFLSSSQFHSKLTTASCEGDVRLLTKMLPHKKTQINQRDSHGGATPLYHACLWGKAPAVALLLQHPDIDVNLPILPPSPLPSPSSPPSSTSSRSSRSSRSSSRSSSPTPSPSSSTSSLMGEDCSGPSLLYPTPLHIACARGFVEIVALLLEHPLVDPNAVHRGMTPLHVAILNGQINVIKVLLASPKVDVNHVNEWRETGLHFACKCGSQEAVVLLLEHPEILVDVMDANGYFPMSVACSSDNFDLVNLFLEHLK